MRETTADVAVDVTMYCRDLDGRRYELRPGQAPAVVLRDGASVRLVARPSEEPAGVCRAAMPVDVRRVESVEEPSGPAEARSYAAPARLYSARQARNTSR
mgnify:CR=1 FL=1